MTDVGRRLFRLLALLILVISLPGCPCCSGSCPDSRCPSQPEGSSSAPIVLPVTVGNDDYVSYALAATSDARRDLVLFVASPGKKPLIKILRGPSFQEVTFQQEVPWLSDQSRPILVAWRSELYLIFKQDGAAEIHLLDKALASVYKSKIPLFQLTASEYHVVAAGYWDWVDPKLNPKLGFAVLRGVFSPTTGRTTLNVYYYYSTGAKRNVIPNRDNSGRPGSRVQPGRNRHSMESECAVRDD